SRFPLKVLACMLRVLDRAGSKSVSRSRRLQFCLPLRSTASAPKSGHRLRDGGSISRLNISPARTPVNASLAPLPTKVHDSGPVWIATPSLYETFIHNTLPAFTGASERLEPFELFAQHRLRQLLEGKPIVGIDADFCSHPHGLLSNSSGIQLCMLDQGTGCRQSIVSTRPDGD